MDAYDFIVKTVQEAGEVILRARDAGFETSSKGGDPRDIVTSVDLEVNQMITAAIQAAFPGDAIHSEETADVGQSARLWTIDPIDGSSNFSRGIPHFAVCLGLMESGIPTAGAVYNPATRELFSFKKGGGAFLGGKPIHVSSTTELKDSFVLFHAGRKSELQVWGGESYRKLLGSVKKTSNLAGSALDACFVAAGRVEANVYGTISVLDIAAAIGILFEAGGVALTKEGSPIFMSPDVQRVYMANNETLGKKVIALLES